MPKRSRLSRNGSSVSKKARMKKEFFEKPVLEEREILLMKNRMSHGKLNAYDVLNSMPEGGWKITPAQTHKGLDWLMKQWKSPKTGAESKNNPFGYREQEILKNFKEFRLMDFYDTATAAANEIGIHYYMPMYKVIAKDGSSFTYTLDYRRAPKTGVYITG